MVSVGNKEITLVFIRFQKITDTFV